MNKPLSLLFILLIAPTVFYAQTTLTGLWTGTLSNDSVSVRKNQTFEIALTEYRGKIYGYSRMNFFVNDTLYYIVKRVKGTAGEQATEVKDDEIITHNFPRQPDKGVKMIYTFRRNMQDSIWRLDGEWKTTASKKHGYYAISGKIALSSEPDLSKSKIFPHLEELNLANDVAFYADTKKKQDNIVQPNATANNSSTKAADKKNSESTPQPMGNGSKDLASSNKIAATAKSNGGNIQSGEANKATETIAADAPKDQSIAIVQEEPGFTGLKKTETSANRPATPTTNDLYKSQQSPIVKSSEPGIRLNEIKPPPVPQENRTERTVGAPISTTTATSTNPVLKTTEAPPIVANPIAALVKQRKTIPPQIVEFISDSLEIKLYDNGEVDGDTVSILMNGSVLLAKQGLKASAIRKTIHVPKDRDEITLVLYAENLGKYPPNTGLVVIRDGEEDYQIRFSADLQQNAAITLRRKK